MENINFRAIVQAKQHSMNKFRIRPTHLHNIHAISINLCAENTALAASRRECLPLCDSQMQLPGMALVNKQRTKEHEVCTTNY